MIKDVQGSTQFPNWLKATAALVAASVGTFVSGLIVKATLKEPPEFVKAREDYKHFLSQEREDNEKLRESYNEIGIALSREQDIQDNIKDAITRRLQAIRARIKVKSSNRNIFQTRQTQLPLSGDLEELKQRKEKLWKEIQFYDDPKATRFIPIPTLPEGELTAAIIKRVHAQRQARHHQKLEISAHYLDVSIEVLGLPSVDPRELDPTMKKLGISCQQQPNEGGTQHGVV